MYPRRKITAIIEGKTQADYMWIKNFPIFPTDNKFVEVALNQSRCSGV